jgi:curved DNA-binding protein CbpA
MNTLYDLLEALPRDDADGLRTAFRKAVKGTHPDLRPSDPDAPLKFRQIVNANQILGDADLRAAYDDLLELAREEEEAASQSAAARTHKLASGVIALAGLSVATVAGFLLFMHLSAGSVASASNVTPESAANATEASDTAGGSLSPAKLASADAAVPTIHPASKFLPAYADSRVIFYRFRNRHHVFPGRGKASRPQGAIARAGTPSSRQRIRMAARDLSRQEGFAMLR